MAFSTIVLVIFSLTSVAFSVDGYSRPYRRVYTRRIVPIKPMNYTAMHRSVKRIPPLNPDAEFITSPSNKHGFHPEKIMERVTQSENQETPKRPQKTHFDYMNFDAYLVKPAELNYKTVWATLEPETEKLLKSLKDEDVASDKIARDEAELGEPTTSSSRHSVHRRKYRHFLCSMTR